MGRRGLPRRRACVWVSASSRQPRAPAAALDAAGLNVRGVLDAARWDALVPPAWRTQSLLPGARAAWLLASGGRALFEAFRRAPESALARDPLDAYTRRVAEETAAALRRAGKRALPLLAFERRGGRFADFVALGRAAGLGAPSRLGLLLHPEYGPWLSIRAALLTDLALEPTLEREGFDPCGGCPAPCGAACPGAAPAPHGFDVGACREERAQSPACWLRCAARHACVLGREHAYLAEAEAHHMRHAGTAP